jgi:hypothetical protein
VCGVSPSCDRCDHTQSNAGAAARAGEHVPASRLENYFRDTRRIAAGLATETITKRTGNLYEASRIRRLA